MSDAGDRAPPLSARFAEALRRLGPGGPVRAVTLATSAVAGGASARMAVIRRFDRNAMELGFHSHTGSRKLAEISTDPAGEVVAWDPDAGIQVRAAVTLSARIGTAVEWRALPKAERMNYTGRPLPGMPLRDPETVPEPDPAAFAVITARIDALDVLCLGRIRHERAIFLRGDGFAGAWVGP